MIGNITSLPNEPPRFFNRGPSAIARLTFFGLLSVALMFVDARFKTLEAVRMAIATVVYPVQQFALLPGRAFGLIDGFFESRDALRAENELLRRQMLSMSQVAQASVAAQAEAARANALLGTTRNIETRAQPSKVLYLGRDHFSQKLFIERRTDQNFESGAAVIDNAGLIGQLTRVHPLLAEVTLITDSDFIVPGKIERTGLRVLVYGRGPARFPELGVVNSGADIVEGDVLLTSNIDGVFPGNLRVCKVGLINRNTEGAFSSIECAPFAGTKSSESVLVLDRPPSPPARPVEEATKDAMAPGKRRRVGG
jgi:rod shape-determining protein MreC